MNKEIQIQKKFSSAIDLLYEAVNPENSFQTKIGKEMRESIYRCIRKLEFWHDELHTLKLE